MTSSYYRDKWLSLQKDSPDRSELAQLARQIGFSFVDRYYQDGYYDSDSVQILCEMATGFSQPQLNEAASGALFGIIVEELCDDYEDFQLETYSRVMAQVLTYCRQLPQAQKLDQRLNDFGIKSAEDLAQRVHITHRKDYRFSRDKKLSKIFILSRVTIGADVALVSVIVQHLLNLFPEAEIVILGNEKLQEIFGGNPRIRISPMHYQRRGGLLDRFSRWAEVLEILAAETKELPSEQALVVDPDSRISQLGMLPLIAEDQYLFFNSHRDSYSGKQVSMAELANEWMNEVFSCDQFYYPRVWIPSVTVKRAQALADAFRQQGCRKIVTVNLGVGDNQRKRLGLEFEKKLLRELFQEPDTVLVLDKGFGPEEQANTQSILQEFAAQGCVVEQMHFAQGQFPLFGAGVLALECGIGEMAGMIAASNEFVGYDSACQHIAAALEIPTVTIFAGTNNPYFIRRWSACGKNSCRIIHAHPLTEPRLMDTEAVVGRIRAQRISQSKLPI